MTIAENGFAEPGLDSVGEGDSGSPKQSHARSPVNVIKALEDQPFEQAVKVIDYIRATDERKTAILKAASPTALSLVSQNGPEWAALVASVSN